MHLDPVNTIEQFPLATDLHIRQDEVGELVGKTFAAYTVAGDVLHIVQASAELVVKSANLQCFGRSFDSLLQVRLHLS